MELLNLCNNVNLIKLLQQFNMYLGESLKASLAFNTTNLFRI